MLTIQKLSRNSLVSSNFRSKAVARQLHLTYPLSNIASNEPKKENSVLLELNKKPPSIQEKFTNITSQALTKYNEIIGFNEIEDAYKRVTSLQESLFNLQNERTIVQLQVSNIRNDLANLQSEIHEHKRGEPRYLELMKREFEIIQQKNRLEEHFSIMDKKEREMFTHLQAKINMLHEKSRSHTRQWGIIATIIGAALGIIGTSISAYYRNNDIRRIQQGIQKQFDEQIQQISKDTQQIIAGYENLMQYMQRYEMTLNKDLQERKKAAQKQSESWGSYLKRHSVSIWRWCTFRKSTTS